MVDCADALEDEGQDKVDDNSVIAPQQPCAHARLPRDEASDAATSEARSGLEGAKRPTEVRAVASFERSEARAY